VREGFDRNQDRFPEQWFGAKKHNQAATPQCAQEPEPEMPGQATGGQLSLF